MSGNESQRRRRQATRQEPREWRARLAGWVAVVAFIVALALLNGLLGGIPK
jgi:hypothetical protein